MSIVMFLLLASTTQAATFNLTVGGSELTNIYSLWFYGDAELEGDSTTFTESGDGYIEEYKLTSDGAKTDLPIYGLKFEFSEMTGTIGGNDDIAFDTGSVITLLYQGTSLGNLIVMENSGGGYVDADTVVQTLYLSVSDELKDIFNVDTMAVTVEATNFANGGYVMSGELYAVPVPGSALLIFSGLACLVGIRRKA